MRIEQVAVQLFTLRNHLNTPEDYAESLQKIRDIGYRSVQVSGPRPISESEIASICADKGLVINSSHEDSQLILENPAKVIENLDALGCQFTAYPYPKNIDFSSKESVDNLINQLNSSGEALNKAGKVLTYHNHNHEFRKIDGEIILERIYRKSDPHFVMGEIDTYWVQMGGGDPERWCRSLNNRLPLLHLKDFSTTEENKPLFAEIGNGVLNFKGIIAAAENSGCQWFIVEQDICPGDPFDSLAQSFRYIYDHLADR